MSLEGWTEDLQDVCEHFQVDLSCLIDGELGEEAAGRALLHLEACDSCRAFFDDTRRCVQLNRDMSNPDRLMARLSVLTGGSVDLELRGIELVHRLATILYRLGKAYVLLSTNEAYRQRVFEKAVPVESTQLFGRGFVDGILMAGEDRAGGLDWREQRRMFNGRLEAIEKPLDKGRALLDEAIRIDPSHEEARLYLAFVTASEGKTMRAAKEFRQLFRTAIDEANRGHAAVQLGLLHAQEKDYKRAIACFRWITISGLADRDDRFFPSRFNIGMDWALMGRPERSLAAFRELLDRHPTRVVEIARLFASSPKLRAAIEGQPGFLEKLCSTCPEIFEPQHLTSGPADGLEEC